MQKQPKIVRPIDSVTLSDVAKFSTSFRFSKISTRKGKFLSEKKINEIFKRCRPDGI